MQVNLTAAAPAYAPPQIIDLPGETPLRRQAGRLLALGGRVNRDELARFFELAVAESSADLNLTAGVTPIGGNLPNAAVIEAAYVGYATTYNKRLAELTGIHSQIATVRPTDNLRDTELWVGSVPQMKLWVANKTLEQIRADGFSFVTMPHEASIEIPYHAFANDRYGVWSGAVARMADAYGWALDQLAIAMHCAGLQGTALGACYDGQNLYDTDHRTSPGKPVQSNLVTGALSSTTYALAWRRFLELKTDAGVPANVAGRRMRLVVGPANREVARALIDAQSLANGADNLERGTADLIVAPWVTSSTVNVLGKTITLTGLEWFLIPEGSAAVLLPVKRAPERLEVMDGYHRFMTGKLLFGIEAEFGATYGMWNDAVGGVGS